VDWDARYAATGVGEPGPPGVLVGRTELVGTTGRALDVACGRGTVAVWLATRGLATDAVDASPAGLALGRELAARAGVSVGWIEADLEAGLPVSGPYDVVVCQRYREPALYPALVEVLATGGLLVLTVLSTVGDAGGRFRAAPGELLAAFGGELEVIDHVEGDGEASLLARSAA
jgi:SAM-dependent methyltransferase